MSTENREPQPFHKSIVEVISKCGVIEMKSFAWLIVRTKIPEGHDEIGAAWLHAMNVFGVTDQDVLAHLDREKRRCRDEAAAKVELVGTLDLDSLKQDTERLLDALNSVEEGSGAWMWKIMVQGIMTTLHKRIAQALGK